MTIKSNESGEDTKPPVERSRQASRKLRDCDCRGMRGGRGGKVGEVCRIVSLRGETFVSEGGGSVSDHLTKQELQQFRHRSVTELLEWGRAGQSDVREASPKEHFKFDAVGTHYAGTIQDAAIQMEMAETILVNQLPKIFERLLLRVV